MQPTILFLIGLPASGKSSIGKIIASEYNFCYLDKDVVCNKFTGQLLESKGYSPSDRECSFYVDTIMDLEYKTLLDIANDNLKLGKSVVIDAPFIGYFSNMNYINQLQDFYQWEDVRPLVLQVNICTTTLKERMIERALDRDNWKLANWDMYLKSVQEKRCRWENIKMLAIDNNASAIDTQSIRKLFDDLND